MTGGLEDGDADASGYIEDPALIELKVRYGLTLTHLY